MKITEARKMAKEYRTKYNLFGWQIIFKPDKFDSIIASCQHRHKIFRFNSAFISINDATFMKDQILHEIAHALIGIGWGHGLHWKSKCLEIGGVPLEAWQQNYPKHNSPFGVYEI